MAAVVDDSFKWMCPFCGDLAARATPFRVISQSRTCSCGAIGLGAPSADLDELVDDAVNMFQAPPCREPREDNARRLAGLQQAGVDIRPGVRVRTGAGFRDEYTYIWFRISSLAGKGATTESASYNGTLASVESVPWQGPLVELLPGPHGSPDDCPRILLSNEMHDRLVAIGGSSHCHVWTCDLASLTWQLTENSDPKPESCPAWDTALIDQQRSQVVFKHCCYQSGDVSIFDPMRPEPWKHRIACRLPTALRPGLGPRLLMDPKRDRCLLLSGNYLSKGEKHLYGYLVTLNLKSHVWQTKALRPIARHQSTPCMEWAQLDPIEDRVIMLGHAPSNLGWDATLWLLNLEDGAWEHVPLSGEKPPQEEGDALLIVPEHRFLLVSLRKAPGFFWRCDLRDWRITRMNLPNGLVHIPFRHGAGYFQHRQSMCLLAKGPGIVRLPLDSCHVGHMPTPDSTESRRI